jgi:AraC-like DNA-binding protein
MKVTLINPDDLQQVEINKKDANKSQNPEIIETKAHFNDHALGDVACSVTSIPNITLFHGAIHLNKAMKIKTLASPNSLNICIMLGGNIETSFYDFKNLQLFNNSHNAIYLVDSEGEHILPKGNNKLFHINIQAEHFLHKFSSEDRITEMFKNSINKNVASVASLQPEEISPEMRSIINSLVNNPYKDGLKKMFLEIKAFELLILQFLQFGDQDKTTLLTKKEKQVASEVRMLLEGDLFHPWTLDELAQKTGSNIQTVKKSFKGLFNINVFNFYQQLRMNYSRHLLLDLDLTVAEVSDMLGYSHQNHFSIAFKKYFGFPPSELKAKSSKLLLTKIST